MNLFFENIYLYLFVWCARSLSDRCSTRFHCLGWCTCLEQLFFSLNSGSWLPDISHMSISNQPRFFLDLFFSHQLRLEERWDSAEHQIGPEAWHHRLPGVRLPGAPEKSDGLRGGVQVRRSPRTALFHRCEEVEDNCLQKGGRLQEDELDYIYTSIYKYMYKYIHKYIYIYI